MMNRRLAHILLAAATTLALAACQKPADAPVAGNAANSAAAFNSVETIEEPDANGAVPITNSNAPVTTIPTAFLGRWGMVPNDCDTSRSDTKGLITITPDALRFYESMGRLETIHAVSPTAVKAIFAFTGEGQSWTKKMTLVLDDGGTVLVRTEQDPAATFRHTRCD